MNVEFVDTKVNSEAKFFARKVGVLHRLLIIRPESAIVNDL